MSHKRMIFTPFLKVLHMETLYFIDLNILNEFFKKL